MLFVDEFNEEEAVDKLKDLGYRVVKQEFPEDAASIRTVKELVEYFYARRMFYNPERKFPPSLNFKDDTKYISGLVRKRQKLGLGRKTAIKEVAVLIDALFKFEEHLKLREPVISPRILEIDSIMNRICTFVEGEVAEVSESETRAFIDEINKLYNRRFEERDAIRAAQSRKHILERIHGQRDRNTEGRPDRN